MNSPQTRRSQQPLGTRAPKLLLTGILLLPVAYVLFEARNLPGKLFAERVRATGGITVLAQTDDRVRDTFAKVRPAQRVEAGLDFIEAGRQTRKHEVRLTAPARTEALAQRRNAQSAARVSSGPASPHPQTALA